MVGRAGATVAALFVAVVSLGEEALVVGAESEGVDDGLAAIVVVGSFAGVVVTASWSDFSSVLFSPEPHATSKPREATVANAIRREETRFMSSG